MRSKVLAGIIGFTIVVAGYVLFRGGEKTPGPEQPSPTLSESPQAVSPQSPPEAKDATLGGSIFESVGTSNPAEKLPDTNPLQNAANPYDDAYKNPFQE